jgi:hypothetical protein
MNLDEFVEATLIDIVAGVERAQQNIGRSGAWINPTRRDFSEKSLQSGVSMGGRVALLREVEFDIAVTVTTGAGGKGELKVAAFSLGGGATREHESISRVKFSVPVVWPRTASPSAAAAED